MFSLPKNMQIKHFEQIANEYHLLENGKIKPSAEPLSREQNIALSESIDFFMDTKKYRQYFAERYYGITPEETDSIINYDGFYGFRNMMMYKMNGDYISFYNRTIEEDTSAVERTDFYFTNYRKNLYDISQYDYAFYFDDRQEPELPNVFQSGNVKINIDSDSKEKDILRIQINNKSFDINPIDSLHLESQDKSSDWGELSPSIIIHEDAHVKLYIDVREINIEKESTGSFSINNFSFIGYVKLKN